MDITDEYASFQLSYYLLTLSVILYGNKVALPGPNDRKPAKNKAKWKSTTNTIVIHSTSIFYCSVFDEEKYYVFRNTKCN